MVVEHWGVSAWIQLAVIVGLVGALHVPLGDYLARVYTAGTDWRVEKIIYRVVGVDSAREQRIADELKDRPLDQVADVDIAVAMMTVTDRLPRPVEVERLRAVLVDGDRC